MSLFAVPYLLNVVHKVCTMLGTLTKKKRVLNNHNSFLFFFCSSLTYFPAENLTEYKWPPDDSGEYYMLQEQVSEYLGVTSFKRKYPGKNIQ